MQSFGIIDDNLVDGWRRASHIMAISTLLRGSPYHLQHDKSYFPQDICERKGVPSTEVLDVTSNAVKSVVQEITEDSLSRFEEAKAIWLKGCQGTNSQFKDMFLLTTPAVFYLQQLKKKGFDLSNKSLNSPFMNVKLQKRLLIQKKFHRI